MEQSFNLKLAQKLVDSPKCQLSPDMQREAIEEITRLRARVDRLELALEPLANIYGYGGATLNDPLRRWFTMGHLAEAHNAIRNPQEQANG